MELLPNQYGLVQRLVNIAQRSTKNCGYTKADKATAERIILALFGTGPAAQEMRKIMELA